MKFDDLQKVWKRQKKDTDMEYSKSELLMLINNKMISFEKDIQRRDWLEFGSAAVVMVIFGYWFFTVSSVWMMAGSAVIVLGCILIIYKLLGAKPQKSSYSESVDKSIRMHLQTELRNVREQKKILQSVMWWYIAPICTGLIFFAAGFNIPLVFKLGYMVFVVLMGCGIWYLNDRAVAQRLDPLINEIEESLAFLELEQK